MGGNWIDRGHGDGESLAKISGAPSRRAVPPTPARDSGRWQSRSGKAAIAAIAAAALVGSAGTAFAIRETLFPSLGGPTSRSVWSNPAPDTTTTSTTSTVPTTTSPPVSTSPAPVPTTVTTVDDDPIVVAAQGSVPGNSSATAGRGPVSSTSIPEIDDSEEHASTTVSNTGPSVPEAESGGAVTTDASGSSGSSDDSGSRHGSDSGSDDSGSGHSGSDDDPSEADDD